MKYGCRFVVCVTSGEGFEEGVIYPVLGENNGIHILRVSDPTSDSSEPHDFVACSGGIGKGFYNSWDCTGKPSFDDIEIKEQPEQKHGHWKGFTQSRYFGNDDYGEPIFRDGLFYVCSECRRKSIIKYPYCPHCGTKMDGTVNMDD